MRKAARTKTLFACASCAGVYVATQECRCACGSFNCRDCNVEIFRWSDNYQYTNWDQVDPNSDIEWKAGKNISLGACRELS
jgi:hypothetical protein